MLLARQTAFRQEPGVFALRGLVARRLFGGFADTKQQATGKQIFDTDTAGSFCMRKVACTALQYNNEVPNLIELQDWPVAQPYPMSGKAWSSNIANGSADVEDQPSY